MVLRYETPLDYINALWNKESPIIFLAGPTVRGNQTHLTSWRIEAIQEFNKQGFDGFLIVPEFTSKTESDKGRIELPLWEFAGLKVSDVIMFWIPRTRELIGLTTNQELGYWMARKRSKVVYGRPDDAYRIQYSDIMWKADADDRNLAILPIFNTLSDTVRDSINLAKMAYKAHKVNRE